MKSPAVRHDFIMRALKDREISQKVGPDLALIPELKFNADKDFSMEYQLGNFIPLERYMTEERADVDTFIHRATSIADVVAELHNRKYVHCNLNPGTIFLGVSTGNNCVETMISSFEYAVSTDAMPCHIDLKGLVDPVYCAPELMGPSLCRPGLESDVYSMGILFYQLLMGSSASRFYTANKFRGNNNAILELSVFIKKTPQRLSGIIIDMINPDAGLRPQAAAVAEVLRQIKSEKSTGSVKIPKTERNFFMPDVFVGRKRESQLIKSFLTKRKLLLPLVLVEGPAGIGKTRFITHYAESMDKITFCRGKFEELGRDIPYGAFRQALDELLSLVFLYHYDRVEEIRLKLREELASRERDLLRIIPRLKEIVEDPPPLPLSSPLESPNRLQSSILSLIRVLIELFGEMTIFLDDLHWADPASLDLIRALVRDPQYRSAVLICAYREEEIIPGHGASLFDSVEEDENVMKLVLSGLKKKEMSMLLREVLGGQCRNHAELNAFIYSRAKGNPFLSSTILSALHAYGNLVMDANGEWIFTSDTGNNAVDLTGVAEWQYSMISGISCAAVEILNTAACIGSAFSLDVLAGIFNMPLKEISALLKDFVRVGIQIHEDDTTFYFEHDRVRESLIASQPEENVRYNHYRIGMFFLNKWNNDYNDIDDISLYNIVDHLNRTGDLMAHEGRRDVLARLNFFAAARAREASSFGSTLHYARIAAAMTEDGFWRDHYELMKDIYSVLIDLEYLNGNKDTATSLYEIHKNKFAIPVDITELNTILIYHAALTEDFERACSIARETLALNNILPEYETIDDIIDRELKEFVSSISGGIKSIFYENGLSCVKMKGYLDFLFALVHLYYFIDVKMHAYVCLHALNCSCRYRMHGYYIFLIPSFAMVSFYSGIYDFDRALDLVYEARELFEENISLIEFYGINHHITNHLHFLRRPLRETEELNRSMIERFTSKGDVVFNCYSRIHRSVNAICMGLPLPHVMNLLNDTLDFSRINNNVISKDPTESIILVIKLLCDSENKVESIKHDIESFLENKKSISVTVSELTRLIGSMAYFIMLGHRECLEILNEIKELSYSNHFTSSSVYLYFFRALSYCSLYNDLADDDKADVLELIEKDIKKIEGLAAGCADNFLHYVLLLKAELFRIQKNTIAAADYYLRAIDFTGSQGFIHIEALGHERAAIFWLENSEKEYGLYHLNCSYRLYKEWGATRKAAIIDRLYDSMMSGEHGGRCNEQFSRQSGSGVEFDAGDMTAIQQAVIAMKAEINLEKLLESMIDLAVQNAGARIGAIIIEKNGELDVGASCIMNKEYPLTRQQSMDDSCYSKTAISYVFRTGNDLIVPCARANSMLKEDTAIVSGKIKSLLCIPISNKASVSAVLYMANDLNEGAFTQQKVEVARYLAGQLAGTVMNALLFRKREAMQKRLMELNDIKEDLLKTYRTNKVKGLQVRMKPHFLINAINTVHSLLHSSPEKASQSILNLNKIFQYLSRYSFDALVDFQEEWDFTNRYLQFEKIRFPNILSFSMTRAGDFSDVRIPCLTVQPLVENAIKHGIRMSPRGGIVSITAMREKRYCVIEVNDNGPGLIGEPRMSGTLGNIQKRLRYSFRESSLNFRSIDPGLSVIIKYPVE